MNRVIPLVFILIFCSNSTPRVQDSYYYVTGIAYGRNHFILKKAKLTIQEQYEKYTTFTNDRGAFKISISWSHACEGSGKYKRHVEKKINQKYIQVYYKDKSIRIKNEGYKYAGGWGDEVVTIKKNIHFNSY